MLQRLQQQIVRFLRDEDGPTAMEYAVMMSLIIVVCVTSINAVGTNANKTFQKVASQAGKSSS